MPSASDLQQSWPIVKIVLEHLVPDADAGLSAALRCKNYSFAWLLLYSLKREKLEACGTLRHVEFSAFLDRKKMSILVAFLPPSIRSLRFFQNSLNEEIAKSLHGLQRTGGLSALKTVDFPPSEQNSAAARTLFACLPCSLESLKVPKGANITVDAWRVLEEKMEEGEMENLTDLSIHPDALEDTQAGGIALSLPSSLRSLDVSKPSFFGSAEAVQKKYVYLGQRLESAHLSGLEHLNLSFCNLTEVEAKSVFPYFPPSLASLDLSGSERLGGSAWEELRKRMADSTETGLNSLNVLHLSGCSLQKVEITFPQNPLTDSSVPASVASAITGDESTLKDVIDSLPPSLEVLDLSPPRQTTGRTFPPQSLKRLTDQFLDGTLPLQELVLMGNFFFNDYSLSYENAVSLLPSLPSSLKKLSVSFSVSSLGYSDIGEWSDPTRLTESFGVRPLGGSLEKLSLRSVVGTCASVLFPRLSATLQSLSFTVPMSAQGVPGGSLDPEGWTALAERFRRGDMTRFSEMEADVWSIDPESASILFSALPTSLKKLRIDCDPFMSVQYWSAFAERFKTRGFDRFRELVIKGVSRRFEVGMADLMQELPGSLEKLHLLDTSLQTKSWQNLVKKLEGGGLGRLRSLWLDCPFFGVGSTNNRPSTEEIAKAIFSLLPASLESLHLSQTQVSLSGWEALGLKMQSGGLVGLKELQVSEDGPFAEEELNVFVPFLPRSLETLSLSNTGKPLPRSALTPLIDQIKNGEFPDLRKLSLQLCKENSEGSGPFSRSLFFGLKDFEF
uniref:Uncharacterized protein n=1 Tax=Chromera velia CCMP2878 TaxID=1169474 RepID=A0A0G4FG79_9ALVE|eukprot:Cvel_16787.t1-p1 / transcript=Cvel_16787.t1 / gene=Cvel_16787 / organism=Chromera_velia_CCMP2878 / gene_product=hypothetical protein / transcript_product=hypothetical protein / location=Cvel_scaffold1310:34708-37062(-) / protein_length=785 / sequence_SO=supercontig / SO=protein_coding / is_pseudo=false